jgi:hypothetical protein
VDAGVGGQVEEAGEHRVGEDRFDHSGSGDLDRVVAEDLLVQILDRAHDRAGVLLDDVADAGRVVACELPAHGSTMPRST